METGKTAKYLKYAIGEIILVMIGILLALQVNNWNEQRKEKETRKVLITSLIEDFQDTQKILSQSVSYADSLFNNMNTFYDLISQEVQITTVDSLKTLARSFFRSFAFEPTLSTYDEAQSSGTLNLLNSKAFINNMTRLKGSLKRYEYLDNNTFFSSGASWDFRKTIGSMTTLLESPLLPKKNKTKPLISYSEYLSIVESPLGEAVLENQYLLIQNFKVAFSRMDNI